MIVGRGVRMICALMAAAVLPAGHLAAAERDKSALSGSCPAGWPRPHVASNQHTGVQFVGSNDTGVASERYFGVRIQADAAGRRL